jgi:RNA polymerase sigma factor (sigma-70 family)
MTSPARVFPPDDEAELRESLHRFVRENQESLLRFLERQCFDRHLAQDALQEALIVTFEKWDIVSTHEKPLYWVRRTARHKLLTLHGQQKWKDAVPLDNVSDLLSEPATAHEAEMVLRLTLSLLPLQKRAVLALMVEGDSDEEIALQLGLAVTTVRTYKTEARTRYRELFRSGGDGGRHESR